MSRELFVLLDKSLDDGQIRRTDLLRQTIEREEAEGGNLFRLRLQSPLICSAKKGGNDIVYFIAMRVCIVELLSREQPEEL